MRRLLSATLLFSAAAALPTDAAPPIDPDELSQLSPGLMNPPLPMSEELRQALIDRDHDAAVSLLQQIKVSDLPGHAVDDRGFLLAWALVRAGRAEEAVTYIPVVKVADHVPDDYRRMLLGELYLAKGEPLAALQVLETVSEEAFIWPRAALELAGAYQDVGRSADARGVYESLSAREDPAEGTDLALLALAKLRGVGSEEAYAPLRRLWASYPKTAAGREAAGLLSSAYPGRSATWQETARRGEQLMYAYDYNGAVSLLAGPAGSITEASEDACRLWYAYGRSHFKKNNVTKAASVLGPAGEKCAGHDDYGAKSLYLAGKSEERKKAWAAAANWYGKIPKIYPAHSYADDGYALAGIATQEAGDLAGARALWEAQVDAYPDGDLAGEGFWRLAWGSYLDGDPEGAIAWAERMTRELPVEVDPPHYRAGIYWAARWRVYPDVSDPLKASADPQAREEAVALWTRLVTDHAFSYYAQLAANRLYELSPETMASLGRPTIDRATAPWQVRQEYLDSRAVQNGIALAKLGLLSEALAELNAIPRSELLASEYAFVTELRWQAGDWLQAHSEMHRYLNNQPPEVLGDQRDRILLLAYPEMYWPEVQSAAASYQYDPRVFHALVREESDFNRKIESWAGAKGLSQLMPATARGVAGWMGMSVSESQLWDPATNLKIGTRYFESLVDRYNGNIYLSMAGYNAGEGNVGKWLTRFGNVPTDELIESIPFRETRHYVKRVSKTYQVYRLLYDEGPAFEDRSGLNHKAVP